MSCNTGSLNGMETDVNCGGPMCGPCPDGDKCLLPRDCQSGVCAGGKCQAPTDTDGVKNDSETDTDCGGALLASGSKNPMSDGAPPCAATKTCLIGPDCASGVCASGPVVVDNVDGGVDATVPADAGGGGALTCQAPTAEDGVKNDSETDVDCGGALLASGQPNTASDGAPACGAGKACALATDCQSLVCTGGTCAAPTANDAVQNDSETDTDCGGALLADGTPNPASDGAPACADHKGCLVGNDCVNLVCATGPVTTPSPDGSPIDCPAGATCTCQPATDADGVKNDSETDTDCGGALLAGGAKNPASDGAPACKEGQGCLLGLDCFAGVCNDNAEKGGPPVDCPAMTTCQCQFASPTDTVKNGGETDVDCGGASSPGSDDAPPCATGKKCVVASDCQSLVCGSGKTCTAPSSTDGVKNDSETDTDCGGALLANGSKNAASDGAPPCADDKGCSLDSDCLSGVCSLLTQTCVDGLSCKGLVKPAAIMDIVNCYNAADPGHPLACPAGDTCDVSSYDCVDANGDAVGKPDPNGAGQHAGIDTCGKGEATDAPALQEHESCCRSLLLPGSTTTRLDKYEVTAGRLRQFAESLPQPYDLRDWALGQVAANTAVGQVLASQIPTGLSGTTNVLKLLPASKDSGDPLNAVQQFGGTVVDPSNAEQGCYTGNGAFGAGVYWWNATDLDGVGSPPREFTQDYYDIKSMNCGLYWVYAAFCAWDGGRLPVISEVEAAYGTAAYPWGPHFLPYDPSLNNGSDYPYETLSATAVNPNTGQVPAAGYKNVPLITQYAASHGTTPIDITVNWLNGSNVNNGGSFYFYPGYVASNPPGTPDTLSDGIDLSPFIASPGRFYLDVTAAKSSSFAGNEGWQDLGANMLEMRAVAPASVNVPGGNQFCDCTGITAGGSGACSCLSKSGVIRATNLPNASYDGGSWEGHTSFNPASTANFVVPSASNADWPTWAQYGKIGFRCARPAEPKP
jgi:hypothetical protein